MSRRSTDDLTAGELVRGALERAVDAFFEHEARVREVGGPEAVHQARVAVRRLRSDLRTFAAFTDSDWSRSLRTDLRELAETLGRVRDADVLEARIGDLVGRLDDGDRPGGLRLVQVVTGERRQAMEDLGALLGSTEHGVLMGRLRETAAVPRLSERAAEPATAALGEAAQRAWRPLANAGRKWLAVDPDDVPIEQLHRLRIRAKRYRYAAEAMAVLDRRAARHAKLAAKLQDELGLLNDATNADRWLRHLAEQGDASVAFVAGQMVALERDEIHHRRTTWRPRWVAASRDDRVRWLR